MSIWIIDDDATLRAIVREILHQEGFEVREFTDSTGVIDALADEPALILLDVRMPNKKGTDLCREIRSRSTVPIIFLSSANEPIDRVVGLELGADDYIAKPFHPRELAARIRAVLRRQDASSPAESHATSNTTDRESWVVGALSLDSLSFRAGFAGQDISLTKTEFRLLETMMAQPRKVFSREELIKGAYDGVRVSKKTIDSHIRRLRSNFEVYDIDPIRTVRGVGYALDIDILEGIEAPGPSR